MVLRLILPIFLCLLAQALHIGYADLTKLGRLGATEVSSIASWSSHLLHMAMNRSIVVLFCPILASAGLPNGIRGEFRQKSSKSLFCLLVNLPFQRTFTFVIEFAGDWKTNSSR
jgi:hypothetical protein